MVLSKQCTLKTWRQKKKNNIHRLKSNLDKDFKTLGTKF